MCHLIAIVTSDFRKADFSDLVELGLGEPDERVASLVPEPVALPEVPELDADDAGECWTNQPTVQGGLGQATWNNRQ